MANSNPEQSEPAKANEAVQPAQDAFPADGFALKTMIRLPRKVVMALMTAVLAILITTVGGSYAWSRQSSEQTSYNELQQVVNKPAGASNQGGLPTADASRLNAEAPTVEFFIDFSCPSCADLDRIIVPTLTKLQDAGQINLQVHAVDFLDSVEGNHYSKRAASAATYVAAHEPSKLLDFMGALLDKDFQPTHTNGRHATDAQIVAQALKAGVSADVASRMSIGTYDSFVASATKYTVNRAELFVDIRGEHRFSTPTIVINGELWPYRQLNDNNKVPDALVGSLGLKKDEVGNSAVLPSIGAKGKALAIER